MGLLELALQGYSVQNQRDKILIIDSIRQVDEIDFLRNRYGSSLKLVGITAP